jgi:hypothetical protein
MHASTAVSAASRDSKARDRWPRKHALALCGGRELLLQSKSAQVRPRSRGETKLSMYDYMVSRAEAAQPARTENNVKHPSAIMKS